MSETDQRLKVLLDLIDGLKKRSNQRDKKGVLPKLDMAKTIIKTIWSDNPYKRKLLWLIKGLIKKKEVFRLTETEKKRMKEDLGETIF